jgi:hypothetical protein
VTREAPPGALPAGIRLAPPVIRCSDESGNSPPAGEDTGWRLGGDGALHCVSGPTHIAVRAEPSSGLASGWMHLSAVAELSDPARIVRCALVLDFGRTVEAELLDQALRWRPMNRREPFHELTPFAMRWRAAGGGHRWEIRSLRGNPAGEARLTEGRLSLALLFDAAALHPRWSFAAGHHSEAAPVRHPGEQFMLRLALGPVEGADRLLPVVAARWPRAAEATFVLTDHCDFDTVDRLAAFMDVGTAGWCGRGLALTKGVFTLPSAARGRSPVPTLEDREYARLIHRLRDDGSEIAPHGLNESGNIDRERFQRALDTIVSEFSPRTWIDHGLSLRYCYTMGGANPNTYDLLGALRHADFACLWAYHDVGMAMASALDQLASHPARATALGPLLIEHLRNREPLVAAHYLRSIVLGSATGRGRLRIAAGHGFSAARALAVGLGAKGELSAHLQSSGRALRSAVRALLGDAPAPRPPHSPLELRDAAPALYPERAVPAHEMRADDLLLFTTQEAVHPADAYTPEAIDALLDTRGLHIGHCYLLNRLPYLAGVFEAKAPRLSRAWLTFLDTLASRVQAGRIWNPTMGELAQWIRSWHGLSVVPGGLDSVTVRNLLPHPVTNLTLLMPSEVAPHTIEWDGRAPAGWRRWPDRLAVWGNVPGNAAVTVLWQ